VNDVHAVDDGVHDCVSTGEAEGVPVHPAGVLPITVLVCCPFEPHADQAEYVYPVHATGAGVHVCVNTGEAEGIPVHPAGVLPVTVLVCWPLAGQVAGDHAEYVYPVHATGVGVPPGHPKVAIAPLGFDE
jgi:hypothetical protein